MNTKDFAAKIRAKYPGGVSSDGRSYRDIPDVELTEKIVTKYPTYKSQIDDYRGGDLTQRIKGAFNERVSNVKEARARTEEGKQSTPSGIFQAVGETAGFVGDVGFEALKTVVPESVQKSVGDVVKKVGESDIAQDAAERYSEWKKNNLEAAENLEAALNIATIIPGVKVAGKTAQVAAKGAEVAATTAGRGTKAVGGAVYKSAIPPSTREAEKIVSYQADTPFLKRAANAMAGKVSDKKPVTRADTALERGLMGSQSAVGVGARRQADKLWETKIAPAVDKSEVIVSKRDLFDPLERRVADTTEPAKRQAYQDALDALKEDYNAFPEYFSLKEAQSLKRGLDEFTPEKVFKGKSVANEYRMLQADMADAIRDKTYNALDDVNIRKDYVDYGNLAELEKLGVKALSEQGFKGGFGNFWSSMWDMVTVPVKTVGGQTLYRVGDVVEFVGDRGIKKFGDFLRKNGYEKPGVGDVSAVGYAAYGDRDKPNRRDSKEK